MEINAPDTALIDLVEPYVLPHDRVRARLERDAFDKLRFERDVLGVH